jgi:hypothetical protein
VRSHLLASQGGIQAVGPVDSGADPPGQTSLAGLDKVKDIIYECFFLFPCPILTVIMQVQCREQVIFCIFNK